MKVGLLNHKKEIRKVIEIDNVNGMRLIHSGQAKSVPGGIKIDNPEPDNKMQEKIDKKYKDMKKDNDKDK